MTKNTTLTLAQFKLLESGEDPDLREARYRRLRATTVLAMASKTVKDLQDKKLTQALAAMRKQNFDMERVKPDLVEKIFETFDEDLSDQITREFRFVPKWTNVRNHGQCSAHCDLCGKGDSLEERENRDKLRYTFRLQNDAGGEDVWVGSTCITHHGLHVDGARTAEEAERLINKAFNQAKLQWKIEAWRDENPDHFEIPELWERFRVIRFYAYTEAYYAKFNIRRAKMLSSWYRLMGKKRGGGKNHFRNAFKQYQSRGGLTEGKHEAWEEAKRLMAILDTISPIFREARSRFGGSAYHDTPEALDWLDKQSAKIRRRKSWKELVEPTESMKKRQAPKKKGSRKKRRPRRVRR